MARGPSPNRELLVSIAKRLGPLCDELVFVGGQVAELLVASGGAVRSRRSAPPSRTGAVPISSAVTISRTSSHSWREGPRSLTNFEPPLRMSWRTSRACSRTSCAIPERMTPSAGLCPMPGWTLTS